MMNFKKQFLAILVVALGCSGSDQYDPARFLTHAECDQFIMKIVRYTSKVPEGANDKNKFSHQYDRYYRDKASRVALERYCVIGNEIFFLVSQPAASLTGKRTATGGRIKIKAGGDVQEYQEIFRTWKLAPDTLRNRSFMLFEKMVKNESLELYYTKHRRDQYIEFPDDRVYFDVKNRTWQTRPFAGTVLQ